MTNAAARYVIAMQRYNQRNSQMTYYGQNFSSVDSEMGMDYVRPTRNQLLVDPASSNAQNVANIGRPVATFADLGENDLVGQLQ